MEHVCTKEKLIIMNNFKWLFYKYAWWLLGSIIISPFLFRYLPMFIKWLDKHDPSSTIKGLASLSFSIFVVFVIRSLVQLIKSDPNEKKFDASLLTCYNKFVVEDRNDISEKLNQLKTSGVDLAWETTILGFTKSDKNPNVWTNTKNPHIISVKRRNRMIEIGLSYLDLSVYKCHAVETNLLNIIRNDEKYTDDINYRNNQVKKINLGCRSILCLKKLCKSWDCKRIVIINRNSKEWKEIKDQVLNNDNAKKLICYFRNHINDNWNELSKDCELESLLKIDPTNVKIKQLLEYFIWHIDNNWEVLLRFCEKDIQSLSSINKSFTDPESKEYIDFLIINKRFHKGCIIFAQNNKEEARIINNDNSKKSYNKWFEKVWNDSNGSYHINNKSKLLTIFEEEIGRTEPTDKKESRTPQKCNTKKQKRRK